MPDLVNRVESYHYEFSSTSGGYDFVGGNSVSHDADKATVFLGNAHRSGVQNPHYKDEIRNGQDATTSLVGETWTHEITPYSVQDSLSWENVGLPQDKHSRYSTSAGIYRYSTNPALIAVPPSVQAEVTNRCIMEFLSACEAAKSSFEAGQDIGEYKETIHSIHKPLSSLRSHINDYFDVLAKKRRLVRVVASLPKVLADTYLEWRFGINPLVGDVAAAIADAGRFRFPVIPVKGHGHRIYASGTARYHPFIGATVGTYACNVQSRASYSVRYKGAIRSRSNASGRIGIAQSLQLLPENWLPTAWDLLPYSWIADYFVNIGEIIRGLSFVSSDLVWACKTTLTSTVTEYSDLALETPLAVPIPYHKTGGSYSGSGGRAKFSYRGVTRGALSPSGLLPTLTFQVPVSKYPFMNMGALMVSRAKSLVPYFR